ncbi:DUF2141 domain-containing protein [Niveispirillum sp. KHB5.9]|uniref:DUF2141 domain-containing protein n=1 Tax=Niveispirillum sp. KHB5.9 TaxID=3400269 RepID=UPI003A89C527
MRPAAFTMLALAVAAPLFSSRAADVILVISDAEPDGRTVFAQLCTEAEFLKRCTLREKAAAHKDTLTISFKDVPPGAYAATAFQDLNDNTKLDRGTFGAPSEPWAVSRGAKGFMGPPVFIDARVEVADKPLTLELELD